MTIGPVRRSPIVRIDDMSRLLEKVHFSHFNALPWRYEYYDYLPIERYSDRERVLSGADFRRRKSSILIYSWFLHISPSVNHHFIIRKIFMTQWPKGETSFHPKNSDHVMRRTSMEHESALFDRDCRRRCLSTWNDVESLPSVSYDKQVPTTSIGHDSRLYWEAMIPVGQKLSVVYWKTCTVRKDWIHGVFVINKESIIQ